MGILNRLERKFSRYAIKGLIVYIVGINGLVYVLSRAYPQSRAVEILSFNPYLILQGQMWRLFTFIFIPPAASILWIFFILYFYYIVGTGLEHEWGSFRFNVYYLIGIIATAAAAFVTGQTTALYLNLSLFLAFAYVYPDYQVLLFFILPVKVRYLAWLNWAFFLLTVFTGPPPAKIAAVASVFNYFLFFGKDILQTMGSRSSTYRRRMTFAAKSIPAKATIHRCTVCGMTEKDDRTMDFRYCSTCEGDYEYCMKHLKTHEHVKKEKKDG